MAFAKFQENRLRIYGEIAENHAILVNLTVGAQNISRKILKITTRYYLTVKLDPALLVYFLFVYGRLFVY